MKLNKFAVIMLIVAFGLGAFFGPKKTREVEKIVYKEQSEVKRDVKKTVKKKETINPDGSKTIETVTESDTSSTKKTDKHLNSEKSIDVRPEWYLIGTYRPDVQSYGLGIQRRIIGEIYAGGFIQQDRSYGISIGVGF